MSGLATQTRLYHGSRESSLADILKSGVQPRVDSTYGNWEHAPSHDGRVYLTDIYALYFASIAVAMAEHDDNERLLVLEVDAAALDPARLYPDEDFIAQSTYRSFKADGGEMEMAAYAASLDLEPYKTRWPDSLAKLGTVAYAGVIAPSAITRYALVDPSKAQLACFQALQPTITLANYQLCAADYRALMRYVMDGQPPTAVGDASVADLLSLDEWTPETIAFYGPRDAFVDEQRKLREQMTRERISGVEVVDLRSSLAPR